MKILDHVISINNKDTLSKTFYFNDYKPEAGGGKNSSSGKDLLDKFGNIFEQAGADNVDSPVFKRYSLPVTTMFKNIETYIDHFVDRMYSSESDRIMFGNLSPIWWAKLFKSALHGITPDIKEEVLSKSKLVSDIRIKEFTDIKDQPWWPNKRHAEAAYNEWVKGLDLELENGERDVKQEMTKTEFTHARVSYYEDEKSFKLNRLLSDDIWLLGKRFTIGISTYLDVLSDRCAILLAKKCLNPIIAAAKKAKNVSFDKLVAVLKEFGTKLCSLMAEYGPMEDCYMSAVGLELLAGIQFFDGKDRIIKETKDWIEAKEPRISPEVTSPMLVRSLLIWLSKLKMPKEPRGLYWWFQTINAHLSSGSARGFSSSKVDVDGETESVRSTPFTAFSSMNFHRFMRSILGDKWTANVSFKVEQKVRSIVTGSASVQILMSILEDCIISQGSTNHPFTSLYSTNEDLYSIFERLCRFIKQKPVIGIDVKAFDHVTSMFDIILAFLAIIGWCVRMCPPTVAEEMALIGDRLAYVLLMEDLMVSVEGQEFAWRNGLLSGLKWTAFLGSILSWCFGDGARALLKLKGEVGYDNPVTQGDDSAIQCETLQQCNNMVEMYNWMGVPNNPFKLVIGGKEGNRFEYLRKVGKSSGVYGYAARSMKSCLGAVLDKTDVPSGPGAMKDIGKVWTTLLGRLVTGKVVSYRDVMSKMTKACVWKSRLRRIDVINWLHTPVAFGGLGFTPFTDNHVGLKTVVDKRTFDKINVNAALTSGFATDVEVSFDIAQRLILKSGSLIKRRTTIERSEFEAKSTPKPKEMKVPQSPLTGILNYKLGHEEVIRRAAKDEELRLRITLRGEIERSERFLKNAGRSHWIEWCVGKIKLPTPNIYVLDPRQLSMIVGKYEGSKFDYLDKSIHRRNVDSFDLNFEQFMLGKWRQEEDFFIYV